MTRTAASVTSLVQIKDVTPAIAKRIRAIWKAVKLDDLYALYPQTRSEIIDRAAECTDWRKYRQLQRTLIDEELETCGVEFLGVHRRLCVDIYYCNAGDSYATTVIFVGIELRVGCWADFVESNLVVEPPAY